MGKGNVDAEFLCGETLVVRTGENYKDDFLCENVDKIVHQTLDFEPTMKEIRELLLRD